MIDSFRESDGTERTRALEVSYIKSGVVDSIAKPRQQRKSSELRTGAPSRSAGIGPVALPKTIPGIKRRRFQLIQKENRGGLTGSERRQLYLLEMYVEAYVKKTVKMKFLTRKS